MIRMEKRPIRPMFLEICMERATSSTQITRSGASATIANFVTSSFGSPPGNGSTISSFSLSYSTHLCWPPQITRIGLSLTTSLSGPQSKSRSTLSFPWSLSSSVSLKLSQWDSSLERRATCAKAGTALIFSLSASVSLVCYQSEQVMIVLRHWERSEFWDLFVLWTRCQQFRSRSMRFWLLFQASRKSFSSLYSSSVSSQSLVQINSWANSTSSAARRS